MTKHNEATNETRAAAAFAAFTAYGKAKERHPEMSVGTERLTDLLCDLRHMAMRDHGVVCLAVVNKCINAPERASECKANAALIAAAPDLLAGARAMLAAIDALLLLAQQHDPATGFNKPVDPYEVTRLLRTKAICLDARAAIAKAEGGAA
jgi:hypothetical protein